MSTYEIIASLCQKEGIAVTALESKLGFGRGSIGKLKTGNTSAKRLQKIADYFGVSIEYLMTGKNSEPQEIPTLSSEDERDIEKVLNQTLDQLLSQDGLVFDGKPATPEAIDSIMSAIQIGLEMAKKKNASNIIPFTDVNKAKEYLRSQKQLAAFNGNIDDVPDEDILEIANALRKKN